jgi:uncharacterized phiE125 gp8 family phage protein
MGLTLVTAPTLDPVSLAEAKAHCRVTTTDEDGLLAGYILAARQHAEQYTRRAFITQTWALTLDEDWPQCVERRNATRDRIVLPRPPAISVTSIAYTDLDGASQTLAADQYRLVKLDTGEHAIDPAYNVYWPSVRNQSATITVTFVAGYGSSPGSIPEPIRQAMLLLIGHWYENRETVNVGNIVNEMPFATAALLSPYRVFY